MADGSRLWVTLLSSEGAREMLTDLRRRGWVIAPPSFDKAAVSAALIDSDRVRLPA